MGYAMIFSTTPFLETTWIEKIDNTIFFKKIFLEEPEICTDETKT